MLKLRARSNGNSPERQVAQSAAEASPGRSDANGRPQESQAGPRQGSRSAQHNAQMPVRAGPFSSSPHSAQGAGKTTENRLPVISRKSLGMEGSRSEAEEKTILAFRRAFPS